MKERTLILFVFLFLIGATMVNSASSYIWVRPFGGTVTYSTSNSSGNGSCTCEATYDSINITQIADNITLTEKIDSLPASTAYDTINTTQRADNITLTAKDGIFERNNASIASVLDAIRATITANNNSIFDEIEDFEKNNVSIAAVMANMRATELADNTTQEAALLKLRTDNTTQAGELNIIRLNLNFTNNTLNANPPIQNCSVAGSCPSVAYDNAYPNSALNTTNLTINTCIFDKNTIAKICFVNGVVVVSG